MKRSINDSVSLDIWIINPYGNLPCEGWRDYRSTMIANALATAGHHVTWGVSNIEHKSKKCRTPDWTRIDVSSNFVINIVPTSTYANHGSFERIRYEKLFAQNFYNKAKKSNPPDVIILAVPSLFYSAQVLKLVKLWDVKLVIDVLDLWPELFHILLPSWLKWAGRILFFPLYARRASLFKKADAIVAVSQDYLSLALDHANPEISDVIYLGVDINNLQNIMKEKKKLPSLLSLIEKRTDEIWVIYAGTLGINYDITTLMNAIELLELEGLPFKVLIAGDGPLQDEVLSTIKEKNLTSAFYLGRLTADEISQVYTVCDIALSTYINGSTVSMPVKIYDYLAAGLPIVNSLDREVGGIIDSYKVGIQYISGDTKSLSYAIRSLATDTEMRRMMAENSLLLAQSFDCKLQHNKFIEICETLALVSK